jgi:hypothetical protein
MSFLGGGLIKNTSVGRFVCSAKAMIGAPEHPTDWLSVHPFQYKGGYFKGDPAAQIWESENRFEGNGKSTSIGNDVWIGQNVVIRQGVTVADGAVVAANAVVTKHVGPYEVVGGVPAKTIRLRFPEKTVERLLSLKWWNYILPASLQVPYHNIDAALDLISDMKNRGELVVLNPECITIRRAGGKYIKSATTPAAEPTPAEDESIDSPNPGF